MQYFDIPTIQQAIERLQNYSANWLLPAFVFAANDVGTDELVDMSKKLGTDQFLDRYFNGSRLNLPPMPRGNNLLRPRLKGISWDRGDFAGDFIIRQDTKMWGNLFSSRGYREMRLEGLIEGQKAITMLTDAFQPRFEEELPDSFRFEDFLVWLFAFEGIPDDVTDWKSLKSSRPHSLESVVLRMADAGEMISVTTVACALAGGLFREKKGRNAYRVVAADVLGYMTSQGKLIQHGDFGPRPEDGGPYFTAKLWTRRSE